MNLNDLKPSEGAKKSKKRIGRGHGSGWGKTASKGHNGQKQRAGGGVRVGFEGGQLSLIRRIPKRGFTNAPFKTDIIAVNLKDILDRFEANDEVTLETLIDAKVIKGAKFIRKIENDELVKDYQSELKIIGDIELDKALTFKVNKISKNAKASIEKAGGSVEMLESRSFANKAGNNKKEEK